MEGCFQFKTQNILEHGKSVWTYALDLLEFLETGDIPNPERWKLPSWVTTFRNEIRENLLPEALLKTYMVYHDCGKPFCRTVDDDGRQHFPNHAEVSYAVWCHLLSSLPSLDTEDNRKAAILIRHDMDVHLLKADGIPSFCGLGKVNAVSLLISGLAELHSNAQMFGGLTSNSFHIKWKQLDKRGRQVCTALFTDTHG